MILIKIMLTSITGVLVIALIMGLLTFAFLSFFPASFEMKSIISLIAFLFSSLTLIVHEAENKDTKKLEKKLKNNKERTYLHQYKNGNYEFAIKELDKIFNSEVLEKLEHDNLSLYRKVIYWKANCYASLFFESNNVESYNSAVKEYQKCIDRFNTEDYTYENCDFLLNLTVLHIHLLKQSYSEDVANKAINNLETVSSIYKDYNLLDKYYGKKRNACFESSIYIDINFSNVYLQMYINSQRSENLNKAIYYIDKAFESCEAINNSNFEVKSKIYFCIAETYFKLYEITKNSRFSNNSITCLEKEKNICELEKSKLSYYFFLTKYCNILIKLGDLYYLLSKLTSKHEYVTKAKYEYLKVLRSPLCKEHPLLSEKINKQLLQL